ncbi:MAG TPA: acyltransferase [Myxococcales bacterium]|nr:acyltransferase [Myxococcales bacterium]
MAAGAAPARPDHLPTLDGWRAIAVLLVMASHLVFNAGFPGPRTATMELIRQGTGQVGVSLFFGLSGLLITTRLVAEWEAVGATVLRPFYIRRFFRIIPAAYLVLIGVTLLGWIGAAPFSWKGLASAALFVTNYTKGRDAPPVGFFWSLCVEEHFYLLFPTFLILLGPRRWLKGTLIATLVFIGWRTIESRAHFINPNPQWWWEHTDCKLDGLLAGAAMAMLLRQPEWRERIRRWSGGPTAWLLIAVLAAATPAFIPDLTDTARTILSPCLLVATVLHPRRLLSRVLETRPMAWIGRVSYSLYLWNRLFYQCQPRQIHLHNPYWNALLNSVLCLAFVSLTYRFIELPLMKVGRRVANRYKAPAAAPAPSAAVG